MYIVTDGEKYAVKKGIFSSQLLDMDGDYWWTNTDMKNKYCWGTLEECEYAIEMYKHRFRKKKIRFVKWVEKPTKRISMTKWQPIKTAPKDGTTICALCKNKSFNGDIAPITIYWRDEEGWCSIWSGYDMEGITELIGWIPLPERQKKH